MKLHSVEQNTPEWLALRAGMPTASAYKQLITSTGSASKSMTSYAQELAGEMYAGRPLDTWTGNQYTEYGHQTEEEAALAYALQSDGEVTNGGFVTDDYETYGCSPDGFVGMDGLVEIKCLPKKHIDVLLYWKKHHKCPSDYVAQVQGQLFVTGREWCDLFFYRPFLPSLVIRCHPDQAIFTALEAQLQSCIEERDRILKILREF